MQILRHALVVVLMVVVASNLSAAGKAKKKKTAKPVHGTIVTIEKEADKNAGTLTVSVTTGKKPDVKTEEKKFKVTEATKIQTVVGKPKDNQFKEGAFSDLAKDKTVVVTLKDDTVESIQVADAKKKKK
jgi:hypothetical protein